MSRFLKISVVASVLILMVAAVVGWQDRQRLESSRERNARAISQAVALGISPVSPGKNDDALLTKRIRESRDAAGRREVTELFALLKKADAEENQDKTDAEMAKMIGRLVSLGPEATELLIRDVLADRELKPGNRGGLLGMLLMKLSSENPQGVLRLLPDLSGISGDKEEDRHMNDTLLSLSLTNWGKKDPRAVGKWIRENGVRFPEAINDSIKCGVLSGAAEKDIALALSLIDEMEIDDRGHAVMLITLAAKSPEERTAALAALRVHFSRSPDEDPKGEIIRKVIGRFATESFNEGLGPADKWLQSAGLTPSEFADAISSVEFHHTYKQTGQWLDWLGKNLSLDKGGDPIGRIMTKWTELDYQEAGRWLAAAPEGPAKTLSIPAYAGAVSKYEPETAAQWAMTLPAGKDLDATLKQIHQNWPKEQAAARDAFAKEHGIE